MDPAAAFAANYYQAVPSLPPAAMRYPYPASSAAGATSRGMIFYPQPMSVGEKTDRSRSSESPGETSPTSEKRPADKKLRRQIANSNERRRMQSINEGFHSLRLLMPHLQGEKMSKASVLSHASEHIYRLNQERERLVQQNTSLRMMLSKYWSSPENRSTDVLNENKVHKATSPMCFDDEKAAACELEQIFATQKELDAIKSELERERARRLSLEARFQIKDQTLSEEEDEEEEEEDELSDMEHFSKRPRLTREATSPRNNLDIIVRAIRQIEGDAFSRSTTPTCGTQDRKVGTMFRPISASTDSSRVSPVTPVCAS